MLVVGGGVIKYGFVGNGCIGGGGIIKFISGNLRVFG